MTTIRRPAGAADDAKAASKSVEAVSSKASPEETSTGSPLPALEFGVGAKAMFRQLSWTSDARAAGLGPYNLTPGPETGAWLEFYPAAFGSQGFAANVGLFGRFDYGFGVATTLANGTDVATSFRDYLGGIKVRIPTGDVHPERVRRATGSRCSRSRRRRTPPDLPKLAYQFIRPALGARVILSPTLAMDAAVAYLMVLDPGVGRRPYQVVAVLSESDVVWHRCVGLRRGQADRIDRRARRRRLSAVRHRPSSRLEHARGGGRRRSLHRGVGGSRGRAGRAGRRRGRRRRAGQALQAPPPPRRTEARRRSRAPLLSKTRRSPPRRAHLRRRAWRVDSCTRPIARRGAPSCGRESSSAPSSPRETVQALDRACSATPATRGMSAGARTSNRRLLGARDAGRRFGSADDRDGEAGGRAAAGGAVRRSASRSCRRARRR